MSKALAYKDNKKYLVYFCPGCKDLVTIPVTIGKNQNQKVVSHWLFDGNYDSPTLHPSILQRHTPHKGQPHVCHHFVRSGKIQFLDDCTHELKGKTVDLPDIPERYLPL